MELSIKHLAIKTTINYFSGNSVLRRFKISLTDDDYKLKSQLQDPIALYNYATYLLEQGYYGSVRIFKQLVDIISSKNKSELSTNNKCDNLSFFAKFNYGVALQESGNELLAYDTFTACRKYGKNVHLYNALAGLTFSLNHKDTTESKKYIDSALNLDHYNPVSNYYMAIILSLSNESKEAKIKEHFDLAINGINDNELLLSKIAGQYFDWLRYSND